jgi:hypothetical protein
MTAWAPAQAQRLQAIADASSDPAVRSQAEASRRLVQSADARATQLAAGVGCGCLSNGRSDDLGPLPCPSCGAAAPTLPVTPGGTSVPAPRPSRSSAPVGGGSASTGTANGTTGTAGSATTAPAAPKSSSSPAIIQLPTLLPGGSSSSGTGKSCSPAVSLPILGGVNLGLCNGVSVDLGH